jgi:hypothetical protein
LRIPMKSEYGWITDKVIIIILRGKRAQGFQKQNVP